MMIHNLVPFFMLLIINGFNNITFLEPDLFFLSYKICRVLSFNAEKKYAESGHGENSKFIFKLQKVNR
jgi:hypothetical protein